MSTKSKIPIYCKCENCEEFFLFTKKKLYCSDSCKKKSYYKRKLIKND